MCLFILRPVIHKKHQLIAALLVSWGENIEREEEEKKSASAPAEVNYKPQLIFPICGTVHGRK